MLLLNPNPALGRVAEEAAQQAMAEGPVVVNRMGCEMQIQRSTKDHTPIVRTKEVDGPETGDLEVGRDELKSYLKGGLGPIGPFISKATEMVGDLSHGMQSMDQEDWSEVLIKTGLKIGTAGIASEVLEAGDGVVSETANQARSKAQNEANGGPTLDELGVSEEWTSILESSPSQWKNQITQEAVKAAKAATDNSERPERVPGAEVM